MKQRGNNQIHGSSQRAVKMSEMPRKILMFCNLNEEKVQGLLSSGSTIIIVISDCFNYKLLNIILIKAFKILKSWYTSIAKQNYVIWRYHYWNSKFNKIHIFNCNKLDDTICINFYLQFGHRTLTWIIQKDSF